MSDMVIKNSGTTYIVQQCNMNSNMRGPIVKLNEFESLRDAFEYFSNVFEKITDEEKYKNGMLVTQIVAYENGEEQMVLHTREFHYI